MSIRAGWGDYRVEEIARLRRGIYTPSFLVPRCPARSWGDGRRMQFAPPRSFDCPDPAPGMSDAAAARFRCRCGRRSVQCRQVGVLHDTAGTGTGGGDPPRRWRTLVRKQMPGPGGLLQPDTAGQANNGSWRWLGQARSLTAIWAVPASSHDGVSPRSRLSVLLRSWANAGSFSGDWTPVDASTRPDEIHLHTPRRQNVRSRNIPLC